MIDNRHLYDRNYFRSSTQFQIHPGRLNKFAGIIKTYHPKKVLDVGCGLGRLVNRLNSEGIEAVGLDFADALLKHYWKDNPHFVLGDARDLKFSNGEFDLVFSSDFFEHINEEDIDQVYSEMKRVGKTVLTEIACDRGAELNSKQGEYHVTHKPKDWWVSKLPGIKFTDPENLEIGSGKRPHKGYLTVDIEPSSNADIIGNFRDMRFNDVGVIRSHHLLEHFGRDDGLDVLRQWRNWLRTGGKLIVETPDFEEICKSFSIESDEGRKYWLARHAYGSQESEWAYHRDGWYESKFKREFPQMGLRIDNIERSVSRGYLQNITVTATKTI